MSALYYLNVTIHLLAALFWLGGMFFLALVGAPVLRKVEPPTLRRELFAALGASFRTSGWVAIAVLLVTGVANLHFRGVLSWEVLGSAAFWGTAWGHALAWKLVAVAGMVAASAVHDFWLGPSASRIEPASPEARTARLRASWLARVNALLGIVVVVAAVRLARGG